MTERRRERPKVSRETSGGRPPSERLDIGPVLETLEAALAALGAEEQFERLLHHARQVWRDSDRLGLVSERTLAKIVMRHTVDSLGFAFARPPAPGEHWVDVGSGAGFPGAVLAATFPESRFTLVEPQRRRAGFLEVCVLDMKLTNARVAVGRAQDQDPASFDVVCTRALSSDEASGVTAESFALLATLARPGGLVMVAAGESAVAPDGVEEVRGTPPAVDSPGRYFMMRV